ncbi:hypothetical protein CONLIGDRAFT_573580 [Coniochaeta ligniaria NRRL 30616]|uniref:F-box domain-containing protein n=1 Tax=Coniochaeta ligniaria NRRL 30616 TaxID=1408157 RepID=A0A1J7ITK3_9PEZI|nr:hypothetical protein CONLIGDRAFT_573580 [Coniochaeta ligniaria NRRL 30616]
MNLTPIKGRGKGPRKAGFRPPNPKRRKLASEDEDAGDSLYKRSSAAPIEKLPTEVLFRILLFSQEHNFPKASLRIGKLLSHKSFFAELVLQAFELTWDLWMGCVKKGVQSYHGWFDDKERLGGDPGLQSKVIALPFITIDNVLHAQQMWLKKNGQGRFYQHSGDYNLSDYDPGYDHMKSAAACFEEEWEFSCFDPKGFHEGALGGAECGRLEVHRDIRIPDRLVTGPFTEKNVKLLFWLVYNHAVLGEDQTWEVSISITLVDCSVH